MTTSSQTVRPSSEALSVLSGLLRDAALLADRGTATPADVDTAMRLGAGHPVGPLTLLGDLTPQQRRGLDLPEAPSATPEPVGSASTPTQWTGPVGVLGTGHMAAGIVEAVGRSGRPVRVLARSKASGQRLRATLTASLDRSVCRGRLDEADRAAVLGRVSTTLDAADLTGSDVVVEAVAEDLAVKIDVLRATDAVLPPELPVATNTSSYRVGDLQPALAQGRPVLALHFFNPAQVMKLVEVVVPDGAPNAETLRAAAAGWASDLGKTTITSADSRGFVVNRLLIPFLNDAVRLYEQGHDAAEVDELLRTGAGHPMGPLALIDLIGVDVTVAALQSMAAVEDDPRIHPASALLELAAAGRLGRKTGAGFHEYGEKAS